MIDLRMSHGWRMRMMTLYNFIYWIFYMRLIVVCDDPKSRKDGSWRYPKEKCYGHYRLIG
jgi:hypothetical protein